MNQARFQCSSWYYAITLTERIASLSEGRRAVAKVEVRADDGGRRMQSWRSQVPFETGSTFAQRLAMDGVIESEFCDLLGEPIEAVCDRLPGTPSWLAKLAHSFSHPTSSDQSPLPEALSGKQKVASLNITEPIIRQGCKRLREGIQALARTQPYLPFDPDTVIEVMFASLPESLSSMMGRVLVLELHVARLKGVLQGDTPEERFQVFAQSLSQPDVAVTLLQEYPVLARQLVLRIDNWVSFSLEFLRHLCADWEAIRAAFSPETDPGALCELASGVGDSHRGGRSVLIAKFSTGLRVVYKPKPLAVDVHFQELLAWLNERGDHCPFQQLKVLDRGDYGWTEFVTERECACPEEVRRFYERQGGYLALLYALEATDFHFENLIAAGEHPMLLDLEALFHPRVGRFNLEQAGEIASSAFTHSVLRVSLLPQRFWSNAESEGIDFSGLGAAAGQITPNPVPQWERPGTDEMRLTRKRIAMRGGQNRPTLNGTAINPMDYTEAIVTGFSNVYRLLLKHREDLFSEGGPLTRFAEDEVRFIVRPTQTYAFLLRESFHPDVMRNALDRDRLFDRLWIGVENSPYLARVIPAEREDLQKGDVPMFVTRPDSRDLWSSRKERIADFLDESGLALVQRRIQQLSDHDLEQQLWFIRASLATLSAQEGQSPKATYDSHDHPAAIDRERLLAAARAVGDRLEALAFRGAHDAAWIGLTHINERHWSLVPLWIDLYDGLPGVALFLGYLGSITGENHYTTLAQEVLTNVRLQVERARPWVASIGGFSGWGGVIYTLAHLGALWDEPAMLSEAEAIVNLLPALIEQDEWFDVIGGAAGCICGLLSLYRCAPADRTLAAAIQCGDRLISNARTMGQGIGWAPKAGGTKPLTGLSHGAAGMALALLELAAETDEGRFQKAAFAAIAYERSLFSPEAQNWPDLRDFESSGKTVNESQPKFVMAWCHGAPGIGLARLRALRHLDDAATRAEIAAAVRTTIAYGFSGNHSLCHGDFGNLELLLQASQVLDDPQLRVRADRSAAALLESINRYGWLCGIPLNVESPGLMTGLAGIGYELLRLAEPERVPSVLTLEPPPLRV